MEPVIPLARDKGGGSMLFRGLMRKREGRIELIGGIYERRVGLQTTEGLHGNGITPALIKGRKGGKWSDSSKRKEKKAFLVGRG